VNPLWHLVFYLAGGFVVMQAGSRPGPVLWFRPGKKRPHSRPSLIIFIKVAFI
jgi:hypothetical protein